MDTLKSNEDILIAASQSFKEKKYWMEKLNGVETHEISFPPDLKIGAPQAVISALKFQLPHEVSSQLIKLSNQSDSRLHMILTASVVLLIERYTGCRDIMVGIPVDKQETEGDFINTVLALRNQLPGHMTFKELLLHVRQNIVEAVEHQNYPVDVLLYDLGMTMNGGYFPLFDVTVILENIQDRSYVRHVNPLINFIFTTKDGHCHVELEFNCQLYEPASIERIFSHFARLLETVAGNVNIRLDDVEILSASEKETLLLEFNAGKAEYPADKTIHALFAEQAALTPAGTALVYEETSVTYKELNEMADRVAFTLVQKGVQPGVAVGICFTRSINMIVGMLGVLKAGGAYLPIDPKYPLERVNYIIADSAVKLLLVNGTCGDNFPFTGETLNLDNDDLFAPVDSLNPGSRTGSDNPAYIIYTSGSMGKPKGVIVEHAAVLNTLYWRKNFYNFNPGHAILQIPSFSFDGSVTDIYPPLLSGARLILINQDNHLDLNYLSERIRTNRVTHFIIFPNFYGNFLEKIAEDLKNMVAVTLAGDNFSEELVKNHFEKLPQVKLFNEYGPTENSVCSTVYEFAPDKRTVLIGKPIANVACYILAEPGKIVPVGVPGELCLSGAGLAGGYLNRVELTDEKFVLVPAVSDKKIYRTGDLAKWREDGNIEFIGRKDHQVKIRGYRIEPAEIERQLLRHPDIKEAVVIPKVDYLGDKFLCAYLVPKNALNAADVRKFLAAYLPDYMIPGYFVEVERFPLNPNGKVDRKKLPEPTGYIDTGIEYQGPRTPLEESLVGIWQKELGLEKIGIHDNYFNIGGDSIKSIRLINTINEELNKKLKVVDLYAHNTIEKLALRIEQEPQYDDDSASQVSQEYGEALSELDDLQKRIMGGERGNLGNEE